MGCSSRRPRVFIGPVEIAGYYAALEAGLLKIGVNARLVTLGLPHPFGYGQAIENPLPARLELALRKRRPPRAIWMPLVLGLRIWVLLWAMIRFDTFVFAFGQSLLPRNADLPVLRLLRKRIIVNVAHGSEMRPPMMDSLGERTEFGDKFVVDTMTIGLMKELQARRLEASADVLVGYPLTAHYLRKPFVNSMALGTPIQTANRLTTPTPRLEVAGGPVRILHAPSSFSAKGSEAILEVLEEVRRRHKRIEIVLIRSSPNHEVIGMLQEVDLVVDQLWSDAPMPGLALEAARQGVPTLLAGYGWRDLADFVPPEEWPPSILCDPDEILVTLETLVQDPKRLRELGAEAQSFVLRNWDAQVVAARYVHLFRGSIPSHWWVDPSRTQYKWGAGSSREAVTALEDAINRVLHRSDQASHHGLWDQSRHTPHLGTVINSGLSHERIAKRQSMRPPSQT